MLLRFLPVVTAFAIFLSCVVSGYPLDYPLVHPYGYDTVFSLKLQQWGLSESASFFWNVENPSPLLIVFALLLISPPWVAVVGSRKSHARPLRQPRSLGSRSTELWNTPSGGGFLDS